VFPGVTKAGLGIGGQYGEGALFKGGKAVAYYNTAGASYGLQAGAQTYGYAMFFMNEAALKQTGQDRRLRGRRRPSVVVLDEGKAKTITSTTMKGRRLRLHLRPEGPDGRPRACRGNKITRITRSRLAAAGARHADGDGAAAGEKSR